MITDIHLGSTFKVGDVVNDKWVILELIGRGGMGEVYRAHQLNLNRDIAIKVISPRWLEDIADNTYEAETCIERFRREVQVMAQLRHPNVLQIFDYGSISVTKDHGTVVVQFIAMEYIPGSTLRATMPAEGFYPEEESMKEWLRTYFLPLLEGVGALHELDIVHRDLKPENVLLDRNVPKITDFGLARSCKTKPITQSFDIKGTPPYMPPEQFLDLKRTDQRTDVYSLGKILYEAVDGRMTSDTIPFKKACLKTPDTFFFQSVDAIIQKATMEERNERFPSVDALREALEELLKNERKPRLSPEILPARPITQRRSGPFTVMTILAAAVAIVLGGMLLLKSRGTSLLIKETPAPGSQTERDMSGEPSDLHANAPRGSLPSTIHGKDYSILHLVPGGKFALPTGAGSGNTQTVSAESFYMDETPVTNQLYVEFLNKNLPRIKVESGMVKGDGEPWLLLGEVMKGYEPIVFTDGKFRVHRPQHAACPVLRVTGYGASAYAHFFGRHLPTETEWLYVLSKGGNVMARKATEVSQPMHGMMGSGDGMGGQPETPPSSMSQNALFHPSPVMLLTPNAFGILGINEKQAEWGERILKTTTSEMDREKEYVVLGSLFDYAEGGAQLQAGVRRYPWEAFKEVGFRTVMTVPSRGGSQQFK